MRALVVDDSRVSRRILSRILGNLGFEVLEAGNGREALACLNDMNQTAHLVMLDWNMPLMVDDSLVVRSPLDSAVQRCRVGDCGVRTKWSHCSGENSTSGSRPGDGGY